MIKLFPSIALTRGSGLSVIKNEYYYKLLFSSITKRSMFHYYSLKIYAIYYKDIILVNGNPII